MTEFYLPASAITKPIIQTDLKLNIVNLNKAAEELFAWKLKKVVGKNYLALCKSKIKKSPLFANTANSLIAKKIKEFDTEIIRSKGKNQILHWQVTPLVDKKNKTYGYLFVGNDVTSHKELQRQDEGLQDYLENILANIPCYIYWKDRNCVYLGCNKLFAQAAGFNSAADIIGKTDYDLAWGETEAGLFRQDDLKVLKGKAKLSFEEPQLRADGKHTTVLASKVPVCNKAGDIIGVLGIYVDITARKKAEVELKEAKERAEIANKAKSEFLAVVSHELRIPLTGILGMAQLLSTDDLEAQQHEQVGDIINAGEHLLSVITDILDFSKLEANKFELQLAPLDFRKLIEETATMLAYPMKAKGLELLINYAEDTPHRVLGDARALRQIFLNLVGNALKFTEKGYIWIKVECLKQSAAQATLVLHVEDSGIGIPEDKQEMVFDRFSQVDASRSRRYGGTGIGLTITKSYIDLMGGTISVQSQHGKGTTFSCVIPFPLQSKARLLSPWDAYKSKVRVLVVDDSLHGEVISRHIASALCELSGSAEALNAIRAAQQRHEPFDIVVINQQLEKVDPMKLAQEIQQQRKIQQPMLVLMTTNKSLPVQDAASAAGFFDCLTKPTHPTALLVGLTAAWERWTENKKPHKLIPLETPSSKKQLHILLVEDDPIIQKVHTLIFEKIGCLVDLAKNGKQTLAKIANGYDAVFMDVGLPDIDGFKVAKKIRRQENGARRIPIIALTGYSDDADRAKCMAAGMNDVAIKPVASKVIKELLKKWVS